jgi:hypothetical protein
MSKKTIFLFISALYFLSISIISADDLSDLLQDLAVQTACLGRYSTAQTGVYVTSRYNDPPDWYDPPMMANRFATMSGNMSRTITFYGVCFDYAQFAWDDIKNFQKMYNQAGMKGQQWYIASTKPNDPYNIILYDPVSKDKATIIMNGVYLRENTRYNIYAHDGASGHAWIWVQHNNGTWYWIDPTWTDNTGYVWWGIVKDGKEIQYYPDPNYCVTYNYPRPGDTNKGTQNPNTTYTKPSESNKGTNSSGSTYTNNTSTANNYLNSIFFIGYNYANNLPLGISIGFDYFYFSINIGVGGEAWTDNTAYGLLNWEGQYRVIEWIAGLSLPINSFLFVPIGAGANHSGPDNDKKKKFVMEIGLMPVLFNFLYFSATYRLAGFKESSFTLGTGIVF